MSLSWWFQLLLYIQIPSVFYPKAFKTVPSALIITVTFMFHNFINSFARLKYFLSDLLCCLLLQQNPISLIPQGLAWIRWWSPWISKFQRILYISFSRTASDRYIYHWSVQLKCNHLHSSQWITFSSHSCLFLYSLWSTWLHSLIMWFTFPSLFLHCLHLQFNSFFYLFWHLYSWFWWCCFGLLFRATQFLT